MDDNEIPHRAETCPHRDMITNDHMTMCQILNKLDKIEERLDSHADKAEEQLAKIIDFIDKRYVTKEAFAPVQKIIYGLVGASLLAVMGALLDLVIAHSK